MQEDFTETLMLANQSLGIKLSVTMLRDFKEAHTVNQMDLSPLRQNFEKIEIGKNITIA